MEVISDVYVTFKLSQVHWNGYECVKSSTPDKQRREARRTCLHEIG